MSKEQALKPTWTWFNIVPVSISDNMSYVRWSDEDPLDGNALPSFRGSLDEPIRFVQCARRWIAFQNGNYGYAFVFRTRQHAREFVRTNNENTKLARLAQPQQIWIALAS